MRSVKGVTLIELMISMTIGVMLSSVCLSLFFTVKRLFDLQQDLAFIQENARVFSVILGEAVRTAGNIGCNAFGDDIPCKIHPDIDAKHYGLAPFVRVLGLSSEQIKKNPLVPNTLYSRIIAGSDVLWLKTVTNNPHHEFKVGEVAVIADCSHVEFLKISKDNIKNKVDKNLFSSKIYYIGDTGRKSTNNQPVFALYSTDLNGRTMELIEGVAVINILYGIKQNDKITYLTFDKIPHWDQVIKIRMNVLLTSIESSLKMWWNFEWPIKGVAS